jgi:hypothetical protein
MFEEGTLYLGIFFLEKMKDVIFSPYWEWLCACNESYAYLQA